MGPRKAGGSRPPRFPSPAVTVGRLYFLSNTSVSVGALGVRARRPTLRPTLETEMGPPSLLHGAHNTAPDTARVSPSCGYYVAVSASNRGAEDAHLLPAYRRYAVLWCVGRRTSPWLRAATRVHGWTSAVFEGRLSGQGQNPPSSYRESPHRAVTRAQGWLNRSSRVADPQTGVALGIESQGRNVRSKCRCSCVLQFTRKRAFSCVFHRPTSQVIHRSG